MICTRLITTAPATAKRAPNKRDVRPSALPWMVCVLVALLAPGLGGSEEPDLSDALQDAFDPKRAS